MAKILTLANSKGGAGKSTLALNLYDFLRAAGGQVALCDADPQQSLATLPRRLELVNESRLDRSLPYQIVVVDTPPYQLIEQRQLLASSDFILIPVKPSLLDIMAARGVLQMAKDSGIPYGIVLNMVTAGTEFPDLIRDKLISEGFNVLQAQVANRISYARAMLLENGLTDEGNEKASDEIEALATEILLKLV